MRIPTKQSTPIKWYGFHWLSWAICKWAGVHNNLENIRSCQTLMRFMELISGRNPVLQIRLRYVESNAWTWRNMSCIPMMLMSIAVLSYINLIIWRQLADEQNEPLTSRSANLTKSQNLPSAGETLVVLWRNKIQPNYYIIKKRWPHISQPRYTQILGISLPKWSPVGMSHIQHEFSTVCIQRYTSY